MTVFVTVVLLLVAAGASLLWHGARNPSRDRIAARLSTVARHAIPIVPDVDVKKRHAYAKLFLAPIQRIFLLADIPFRPLYFVPIGTAVAALITFGIVLNVYISVVALTIAAAATVMHFRSRAERNRQRFLEDLPSFIDRLQQFLGAGNSLVNAFEKALEYSTPLTRAYLLPVALRLAHGAGLAESLHIQGQRLGVSELTMMSIIFHANLRFGGSLSEVLSRLVTALNNRLQVQREFNAMTAEMRSTAKVLVALPIIVAALVFVTNPRYLGFFANDPFGRALFGVSVACAVLGVMILRHITRIEA